MVQEQCQSVPTRILRFFLVTIFLTEFDLIEARELDGASTKRHRIGCSIVSNH